MKGITNRILAVFLIVVMAFSVSVFDSADSVQAATGKVKKVAVTNLPAKTLTLKKGKSKVLKVKVTTSGKSVSKDYSYESSDKSVVTVSKSGKNIKVKAKKKGKANVVIKSKANPKKKVTIKVTVGTPVSKVSLNSKKATVVKGKTFKLKATVTSKSASNKAVVWTTSSSKKATVNSKGVVTAKSAGTVTITATAADGSGKKASCKVTVVNPADIKSVTVLRSNVIKVTLTRAQTLSTGNFVVKKKIYAKGTYNKTCKIDDVYTTDKVNYYIILDDETSIYEDEIAQVAIKGLDGNSGYKTKEATYNGLESSYSSEDIIKLTYNENADETSIYIGQGKGYKSVTWKNLPSGIKGTLSSTGNYIYLSGKPTVKGTVTSTITIKDEFRKTYTKKIIFIIGSTDKIVAASTPEYTTVNTSGTAYIYSYIYVNGGSGSYNYEITGNNYGLQIDSYGEIYGSLKPGTYKVSVKVTDANNESLSGTTTAVINVKNGITVKGTVKDLLGKPVSAAEVMLENRSYSDPYCKSVYVYTDSKGTFTAVVPSGTYDIVTTKSGASPRYVFGQKITANKSDYVFTLNAYKVTINSNNSKLYASDIGAWYDSDGKYCGYGSEIYLKPGSYKLSASGTSFLSIYEATVSVNVTGATTVTANVKVESTLPEEISENNTLNVTLKAEYEYYKFVPKKTGNYYFYSENGEDPVAALYDKNGIQLVSDDDSGTDLQFYFSYSCEAGEEYYLAIKSYEGDGDTADITISDTNPDVVQ